MYSCQIIKIGQDFIYVFTQVTQNKLNHSNLKKKLK